jgi:hypothetical protein
MIKQVETVNLTSFIQENSVADAVANGDATAVSGLVCRRIIQVSVQITVNYR